MEKTYIGASIIVGFSLIIASAVFGWFFYESRKLQNTVKVVGIATKSYEADTVKWNITLEHSTEVDNIKTGYQNMKQSLKGLTTILTDKGIDPEDIIVNPINTYPMYDRNGKISGYRIQQILYVISQQIDVLEEVALNPEQLTEKEIFIQNSNLEYFYSQIDQLKKELLSHATQNAKERALEIIKHTDVKLSKLVSLRAGVFQITEPYSTKVSGYGVYNTSSRKKEIKVTAHAVFRIQ